METTSIKMSKFMEEEYKKSCDFWNNWMSKEEELPSDADQETAWQDIGSKALADAPALLKEQKHVLDYGCGAGWASVIMVKSGCQDVTAVDVSENGIESSKKYAKFFHADDKITFKAISPDWLSGESPDQFDGLFTSNVLDVIPASVCEVVLKGIHNICKKGAKIIIGLNPCFPTECFDKQGFVEKEPAHLFCDDILRIVNHTDEEWEELFEPYFNLIECNHYRFDGEANTVNRRIFILENK